MIDRAADIGPRTVASRTRSASAGVRLIVVAYVLCLLPYASDFITFLSDEDSYVQGALIMMDSGDYLTPRTGENSLRLIKPPLAYWLSVAGMKVFGISVLGARVFWLIMDAPLIFFMLLAMSGFVGLLTQPDFRKTDAWMAYGGTALAILTKGLLPAVMLIYFVGAAIVIPAARARAKRLLAPLPIIVSLAVAASWFVYQFARYPEVFLQQFVGDQVAEKVGLSIASVATSFVISSASLVLPLLAWLLILLTASRAAGTRPSLQSMGVAGPLLAGWSVVNILVFVPATNVYVRYVLTALPALTILVAVAFASVDREIVRRHLQGLSVVAIVFVVPVVAVVLAASAPLIDPLAVSALFGTLVVATIALVVATRSKALVVPVVALGLLPVGTLLMISPSISAFATPDIASVIAAELKKVPDVSDARIVFLDAHREAVKTQVYERRTEPFEQLNGSSQAVIALMAPDNADQPDIIVTRKKNLANELSDFGYEILELRGGWRDVDWGVLVNAIRQGTIRQTRERSADRAYVAFRPS